MAEDLDVAERIFVAQSLLDETNPDADVVTVADIARFMDGRSSSFTMEQTRYMFSRPKLLTAYRQLRQQVTVVEVPAVAAASDGKLNNRAFEEGRISISRQPDSSHVYIVVTLGEGHEGRQMDLLLENTALGIERLSFQSRPDDDGEILEIVDTTVPRFDLIVTLLQDPATEGRFVLAEPDAR